jgi:hypothetical protein
MTKAKIRAQSSTAADAAAEAPPIPALSPADREAIREALDERAAIREFDGGEPREIAEAQARAAMRAFRVLVAMPAGDPRPPRWVTTIAPGCDLAEVERTARLTFGDERVIEVREQERARP